MSILPESIYLAAQVRELDRRSIEGHGMPGFTLMQRAAAVSFAVLKQAWPDARRLHVICGPGNNGGDGLLLAVLALDQGFQVTLSLLCSPASLGGDAAMAWRAFVAAGGQESTGLHSDCDVIVDALLGTGTSRELEGDFLTAVKQINAAANQGTAVLALDIPSGLAADTGAVLGAAVKANVTVSFIGMKLGLLTGAGPEHTGKVYFSDLDVPAEVYENMPAAAKVIQDSMRQHCLKPRARHAHKNRHGHVLCIGGDYGTAGAIQLSALAALRGGAGLVSVATRPEVAIAMSQAWPELMCVGVQAAEDLSPLLAQADAVLLGPGLGQQDWGRALFSKGLECRQPLVLDADGLNLLALNQQPRENWVLTPHPGEAARLLGLDNATVQADRLAAILAVSERYAAVSLLKGAGSLVTDKNSPVYLCNHGNPGMAVGGMGDLLSGVIVSLIAQGLPLLEATCIAVDIHAQAGDMAAKQGERGLLPSDLLPFIRELVNP